jgi:putative ABC transport system permease protein
MIKLIDVTKIYTLKKGPQVVALNRVNLVFGETGLVFILGKSGAGKSTLLNILGGLDRPSSGEVLIQNQASESFSASNLDSYRNTYCGFIFQEYNLLPEFTLEENIALALELQNKKATSEEIEKALQNVGLEGLGSRHPDALSGGQKQRVAIARALIKNPEILLADEPTGALDSQTGKEIFSILKTLAKTHLVIVVSHDREFAEYYGDRVIEIGDGMVKSDITKKLVAGENASSHFVESDPMTLFLPSPSSLTEKEKASFHAKLRSFDAPVFVSFDAHLTDKFREQEKIDSEGYKGSFSDTDNAALGAAPKKNLSLIKGHLPFLNALKVALAGLKAKPFKLVLTFLLSMVSFTMFALADTMVSYNAETVLYNSLMSERGKNLNYLSLSLQDRHDSIDAYGKSSYYYMDVAWDEKNIALAKNEFGEDLEKVLYTLGPGYVTSNDPLIMTTKAVLDTEKLQGDVLFNTSFSSAVGALMVSKEKLEALGFTLLGNYPTSGSEIAISRYQYEYFQKAGFHMEDKLAKTEVSLSPQDIATPEAFLSHSPELISTDAGYYFSGAATVSYAYHIKIVGIVDTHLDEDYFRKDTAKRASSAYAYSTESPSYSRLTRGYERMLYVAPGFANNFKTTDEMVASHSYRLLTSFPQDEASIRHLAHLGKADPHVMDGTYYRFSTENYVYSQVNRLSGSIQNLRDTFFWMGFAFAIFSCLLLAFYIGNSISLEQRQIGILRAIGARGKDIYGIYSLESLLITLSIAFVSVFTSLGLTYYVNQTLRKEVFLNADFVFYSFRQVGLLIAIAAGLALVASFVPCLIISHKKPIDSINER